jgi:hypothetical protein
LRERRKKIKRREIRKGEKERKEYMKRCKGVAPHF